MKGTSYLFEKPLGSVDGLLGRPTGHGVSKNTNVLVMCFVPAHQSILILKYQAGAASINIVGWRAISFYYC